MTWNAMLQWYTQSQNEVLKKVLADLPETEDVTYFSDGCAS